MPFSQEKADFVVNFIQCLKLGDDFYGQPFMLQPWQKEAVSEFYGTLKENGFRKYWYLYFEIPKKNGKSQLAAALGLYHTFGDGSYDGEVYVCAADKDNASIVFNAALSMLDQCPYLKKRAKIKASQRIIEDKVTHTKFKVLSAEAYSKHGYKPTCVIFDELHAQPNRDLWDIMTFGSGSARKQPVYIVLTTAGDDPDRNSIGWEIHEKARKIYECRRGNKDYADNPIWLPFIWGLGGDYEKIKDIDIFDEKVWYECNPSLGITIDIDVLRSEALDARSSKASERLFRWLRLNQWISVKSVGWLPSSVWDETTLRPCDIPDLTGLECWGGLDLSSTTDISALALTFPPQERLDFWFQLFFMWKPEELLKEHEVKDGVPYTQWAEDGYLLTTPGRTIKHSFIVTKIIELSKQYRLSWIGADPWHAAYVEQELTDAGINVAEIPQDLKNISLPMKNWERMLLDKQIFHSDNPVTRMCFCNVKLYVDSNLNQKPDKIKSKGRIDTVAAGINSIAMHSLRPAQVDIFYSPEL